VADDDHGLTSLLEYVKAQDRVCPMPIRWDELWQMLPGRQRQGGTWEPAPPLILGAWWDTPSFAKMERLAEHINYASAHGVLANVDQFLRALPETEWAHVNEFITKPAG
jgi:hypothetical protein